MIKRLIIFLFLLFMLNLTYQPVYRTALRQKSPVTVTIKVDTDKCTGLLINRNREYFRSEKFFLYISFKAKDFCCKDYYNTS